LQPCQSKQTNVNPRGRVDRENDLVQSLSYNTSEHRPYINLFNVFATYSHIHHNRHHIPLPLHQSGSHVFSQADFKAHSTSIYQKRICLVANPPPHQIDWSKVRGIARIIKHLGAAVGGGSEWVGRQSKHQNRFNLLRTWQSRSNIETAPSIPFR